MNLSYVNSLKIKKIPNLKGSFGFLATHKSLGEGQVIKVLNTNHEGKRNIIKKLLKEGFIEGSGYPLDEYLVNGKFKGYIMPYYKEAYKFKKAIASDLFTYQERLKACLDCTNQLKQIHQRHFIFNDVSLSNQLIDNKGGHLIDLDAITTLNAKKIETHYNIALNGTLLNPSYNLDKIEQALTNLSLIYQIDFEEVINNRTNDVKSLFSLFKDNRDIYNLFYSYLSCDNTKPYFDILLKTLKDEERVNYQKNKIYKKIQRLV